MPGNLVSLCRRCNELKLDQAPSEFYSTEELTRLQPLLEKQQELFAFSFDWDKWEQDRGAYLIELGIEQNTVQAALYDETFIGYVGVSSDRCGIAFIGTPSR